VTAKAPVIVPIETLEPMEPELELSELGRGLLKWLASYPMDFKLGRYSDQMPAVIRVENGRVCFQADFGRHTRTSQAVMLAHDLAHFMAAPSSTLHLPNLGLHLEMDQPYVMPPRTDESLRTEELQVFAYQATILRHFNTYNEKYFTTGVTMVAAALGGYVQMEHSANWREKQWAWVKARFDEMNLAFAEVTLQLEEKLAAIKPKPAVVKGPKVLSDLWAAL
jgi:hypothetical protein